MGASNAANSPLDLELVRELCDLAEEKDLASLDISYQDFHFKVRRVAEQTVPTFYAPVPPAGGTGVVIATSVPQDTLADDLVRVCAPLAGVFYRAPGPESPPFVEDGTVVSTGQVLCIIEAMKMMNEIAAETPGRVVRSLVANGEVVAAGQEIFYIKPLA